MGEIGFWQIAILLLSVSTAAVGILGLAGALPGRPLDVVAVFLVVSLITLLGEYYALGQQV